MKRHVQGALTGLCAVGVTLSLGIAAAPATAADDEYEVLVVGETLGFRHSHIDDTTNAIIALGEEHGFSVDVWDPPQGNSPGQPALTLPSSPFTSAADLSKYATIIFASPVDATNTSSRAAPICLATAPAVIATAARPRRPVKALALPALTMMARTRPRPIRDRHHSTGGAAVSERVKTPAMVDPGASSINIRSVRPLYRMPVAAAARRTPGMGGRSGKRSGAKGEMGYAGIGVDWNSEG